MRVVAATRLTATVAIDDVDEENLDRGTCLLQRMLTGSNGYLCCSGLLAVQFDVLVLALCTIDNHQSGILRRGEGNLRCRLRL